MVDKYQDSLNNKDKFHVAHNSTRIYHISDFIN